MLNTWACFYFTSKRNIKTNMIPTYIIVCVCIFHFYWKNNAVFLMIKLEGKKRYLRPKIFKWYYLFIYCHLHIKCIEFSQIYHYISPVDKLLLLLEMALLQKHFKPMCQLKGSQLRAYGHRSYCTATLNTNFSILKTWDWFQLH